MITAFEQQEKFKEITGQYILQCRMGSFAYGTMTQNSDIDILCVVKRPMDYYLGMEKFEGIEFKFEQFNQHYDVKIFDIKKYFELLFGSNPDCIFSMFLRGDCYLFSDLWNASKEFSILIKNRNIFITKKLSHVLQEFGKSELEKVRSKKVDEKMGDKRKKIFYKYGYDCKSASHSIRLMTMSKEILTENKINVDRSLIDSAELKMIKEGSYNREYILDKGDELYSEIQSLKGKSTLPESVSRENLNSLLMELWK
jgi:predicted nucleotidyltransferase